MRRQPPPDLERLKEILAYDPITGIFRWRQKVNRHVSAGDVAGTCDHTTGYVQVGIFGRKQFAHRLAWYVHTGEWPDEVDHVNRHRSDNRIVNLRAATRSMNAANNGTARGASEFRGVIFHRPSGLWRAWIRGPNGQEKLGYFLTAIDAARVRDDAAKRLYGEFARLNFAAHRDWLFPGPPMRRKRMMRNKDVPAEVSQ